MTKKAIIIGAGFGGLGTACLLAKAGWEVKLIEKNEQVGGRAGVFEADGFRFDTGPSWFLMPDVFEKFFESVGENLHEYVDLIKLQPSYQVTFKDTSQSVQLYGDQKRDTKLFESIEVGAGAQLKSYLERSEFVYKTSMDHFLYKNYDSVRDFITPKLAKKAHKLSLFSTMDRYVRSYFKDVRLQQIMQYPLVFLGSSPCTAPALYNLMSHVDFNQGVFYPNGGMYELTKALHKIALKNGISFELNNAVEKILTNDGRAIGVRTKNGMEHFADVVVSNADPYFTETKLLQKHERDHTQKYWNSRVLAPSALLIYLGVNRTYENLEHHNLVFCKDWQKNFAQIYDEQTLPDDPSFYVCAPSRTVPTVAPKGKENLFVLVPIPAGLAMTKKETSAYADKILQVMEKELDLPNLRKEIIYQRIFSGSDFESRYNSFRGTGLGLAHTLRQTALWRPANKSKKVKNLYYAGANVHPGIGLPVCLISAELVARRILK